MDEFSGLFRPERVAVVETIGRLGQLAVDFPGDRELDVNPILAASAGMTALDYRLAFDPDQV